ncbi:MAG: rhodanese-like domain-containing protein [Thermodesulfobacteriota bacterium]|nr:rhodanese-like domain-containing protein [Thermodesulfobacteriota bacterium]
MSCLARKAVICLACVFIASISAVGNPAETDLPPKGLPADLFTVETRHLAPGLFVSAEAVLQMFKEKQDIILVDVRHGNDFEKFRIPGSINIPFFALKTKIFFKKRLLILINEGFGYSRLEQGCLQLRSAGFARVLILDGGLQLWNEKGAPLEGDVFAKNEMNKVLPQDLFQERDCANLVAVDVSETATPEAGRLIPRAVSVPYGGKDDFTGALKKIAAAREEAPATNILIFNRTGKYAEGMERLIKEAGLKNIFYLQGGLAGYNTFLLQQAAIWRKEDNRKTVKKKCATCP